MDAIRSFDGDYNSISKFFLGNLSRIADTHCPAAYYSWLSSCSAAELFGVMDQSTYEAFKRLTIACPVDVYVYDESGDIAATVINEQIVINTLAVSVEDGSKTVDLPGDQEYSIRILARDNGNVNYTVSELSAEAAGDSILRTVEFYDIDIAIGDTLTGAINDVLYTEAVNYALTKNADTVIQANYDSVNSPPDTPLSDYSIEIKANEGQTVVEIVSIPTANATLFVTAYDGAWKQLAIQLHALHLKENGIVRIPVTINTNGATYVTAILADSVTLAPLANKAIISIYN